MRAVDFIVWLARVGDRETIIGSETIEYLVDS